MKRIFTLLSVCATLFTVQAKSQFTENFEDLGKFTGSCWSFSEMWGTNYAPWLINGNYSLITNPATNQSATIEMMTPALNITSTSLHVSFKYKMNVAITTRSSRTIEIGLLDVNGTYTYLDLITLDKNTPNPSTGNLYDRTFYPVATGLKKLVFRMGGDQGLGFIRVIFDDLYASANARYTTNGGCNMAPIAVADYFVSPLMSAYSDNVVTNSCHPRHGDLQQQRNLYLYAFTRLYRRAGDLYLPAY
jgi:hypothetical protein